MSRSISISYRDEATGVRTAIEVPSSFSLLGGQRSSMAFWSLPRIKEVGIERLSELGVADLVTFFGWDDMALLKREIALLAEHLASIDWTLETKCEWLCNLTYCYHRLNETAPKATTPIVSIG